MGRGKCLALGVVLAVAPVFGAKAACLQHQYTVDVFDAETSEEAMDRIHENATGKGFRAGARGAPRQVDGQRVLDLHFSKIDGGRPHIITCSVIDNDGAYVSHQCCSIQD